MMPSTETEWKTFCRACLLACVMLSKILANEIKIAHQQHPVCLLGDDPALIYLSPWYLYMDNVSDPPPHSSIMLATFSTSSPAILRRLLMPSRTTWTTCASITLSRLQNGGITPASTTVATWNNGRNCFKLIEFSTSFWWSSLQE